MTSKKTSKPKAAPKGEGADKSLEDLADSKGFVELYPELVKKQKGKKKP